jgi:hypothetical protein
MLSAEPLQALPGVQRLVTPPSLPILKQIQSVQLLPQDFALADWIRAGKQPFAGLTQRV